MVLAGIKVPDTILVRDAIDLSRSASEPFLFNHVMRSWLFGVLLSESAERLPDAELLAVATIHIIQHQFCGIQRWEPNAVVSRSATSVALLKGRSGGLCVSIVTFSFDHRCLGFFVS